VVLNAKSDSVLISAAKSVGLSSNESINADSPSVRIHSPNIVLGPSSKDEDIKESPESALLGDTTVMLLNQLCLSVKAIATLLETSQIFPGGTPVPDAAGNIIGSTASSVVQGIIDNLSKTKSKYIKLK